MRVIVSGDMVVGRIDGSIKGGILLPSDLRDLPLARLRCVDNAIIDAAKLSVFYVDESGYKHVKPGKGRKKVSCAWDDKLTEDGVGWRTLSDQEIRAPAIKDECAHRIRSVLSDSVQKNLASYGAEIALMASQGDLAPEILQDVAALKAARQWVMDMLVACRKAIRDGDPPVWPSVPTGVVELVERF